MRKRTLLALVLFSFFGTSRAQVAAPTPATLNMGGGSAAITPDFIVDWSVGESTIIETYYGENAASNLIVSTDGLLPAAFFSHLMQRI